MAMDDHHEGKVVVRVGGKEPHRRIDPLEAVISSREGVPLEDDEEHELTEGHGEDGKIDPSESHAEKPEDEGGNPGGHHRNREA